MRPLKIGLIGLGTVGGGVARILQEQPERMTRRAGRPIEIGRVVVRDLSRPRNVILPRGIVTEDVHEVLRDPTIDVVVELMGGVEPAREYVSAALEAGKDVVSANKALIYEHGPELFAKARKLGRTISFEAAVAGGVPIIAAVTQSLSANQIHSIEAILNGTSNFILSEMSLRQRTYEEAVSLAQQMGYAEADPALDVDGTDAAHKLTILVQLAFGTKVPLSAFLCQGIERIDITDHAYAAELGYRIKLLALARMTTSDRLEMRVRPTLIRHNRLLATVEDVYNGIEIEGDLLGKIWFSGMGAGQNATASAVLADLVDVASGKAAITFPMLDLRQDRPPIELLPSDEMESRYYLRFNVADRPHVFADIADILGRHDISLASIIQHEAPESAMADASGVVLVPLVVMTHRCREGQIQKALRELASLSSLRQPCLCMAVTE